MRSRELRKLLFLVAREAQAEINASAASGGKYACGLSSEGYVGGYREAIYDVIAMMDHGQPADQRGFWQRARAVARPNS